MLRDKKLLAVKISKCGTNSLNIILEQHDKNWNRTYYYGHDPYFPLFFVKIQIFMLILLKN